MKHPKDMTPEEFWGQYENWLWSCSIKVASKYANITPRDLLGEAYLAARYSAKFWDPEKEANFLTYSKKLIVAKLNEVAWKEMGTSRPLPSERSVKDPGTKAIPLHLDVLGPIVFSNMDHEVTCSLSEDKVGSDYMFTLSPLELLIYKRFLDVVTRRIEAERNNNGVKLNGEDKVSILENTWVKEISQRASARALSVSYEAVCLIVRRSRKKLAHDWEINDKEL